MPEVTVIDYGVGNLLSVRRGFERVGANVQVTSDAAAILAAPRVVLPGVGAFRNAMEELHRRDLVGAIRDAARGGAPFLGICLGMQMLLDESEEFGLTEGLGLIAGRVVPVPARGVVGEPQKVPHIGWSDLQPAPGAPDWSTGILRDVTPGESVYFVHSFMAEPRDPAHRVADHLRGGQRIAGVIGARKVWGCQFHPEKSGEVGLKILRAFCGVPR